MTKDPLYTKLCEARWRRKLTSAEEAQLQQWMAAHPEMLADWETETRLNEVLELLPDAAVASNFTARVVEAAEREAAAEARAERKRLFADWRRLVWAPAAATAVVVVATLFGFNQFQKRQRAELAHSVAAVSGVASLPGPEILTNFDAIWVVNSSQGADEQLISLLQ